MADPLSCKRFFMDSFINLDFTISMAGTSQHLSFMDENNWIDYANSRPLFKYKIKNTPWTTSSYGH